VESPKLRIHFFNRLESNVKSNFLVPFLFLASISIPVPVWAGVGVAVGLPIYFPNYSKSPTVKLNAPVATQVTQATGMGDEKPGVHLTNANPPIAGISSISPMEAPPAP